MQCVTDASGTQSSLLGGVDGRFISGSLAYDVFLCNGGDAMVVLMSPTED